VTSVAANSRAARHRSEAGGSGEIPTDNRVGFDIYDSFTERRFTGNVAGVVVVERELPASTMGAIAAELGAPTTGFCLISEPVAIRYFTPAEEIDACGHVTVAIATALAERGIWSPTRGGREVMAHTAAGEVPIRLVATEMHPRIELTYRPRPVVSRPASRTDVEASLGGVTTDHRAPLELIWTGLRHLLVPFSEPDDLSGLGVSREALVDLAGRVGFDTLCAFARVGGSIARMRDFCAPIGALEEPASGTTSAALGLYLRRHRGMTTAEQIVIEQGVEMGRPSKIEVAVADDIDGMRVRVGGSAIKIASGVLLTDQEGTTGASAPMPEAPTKTRREATEERARRSQTCGQRRRALS
jgi:PhzF family phenazine biosynthesis protein